MMETLETDRMAGRPFPGLQRCLLEAIAVASITAVIALVFNALRPVGLPLIARTPYQILIPCPEPGGPVQVVQATDSGINSTRTFLVDARSTRDFDIWHVPRAVNLTYDWLDPVPEDHLLRLAEDIAASGANRVMVYGDGDRPDSGEHLGKEISGRGIKNVFVVSGGAPALLELESR